jgi:hypothetical protein
MTSIYGSFSVDTRAMCLGFVLLLGGSVPLASAAPNKEKQATKASIHRLLQVASLKQLGACLQAKAGFDARQQKQLATALSNRVRTVLLKSFQMTGFQVGGYCGEQLLTTTKRKRLFQELFRDIKGYFACMHKRRLICQSVPNEPYPRCWKVSIAFLFQAFSDGTPFKSKMPRPFVCQSPGYSFATQQANALPRCANARAIAKWKGDEQHLLGMLRGCTLELMFRRHWKAPFQFRQEVIINKQIGENFRGGNTMMSLRFTPLPRLRVTKSLGSVHLPASPFFRPLTIYRKGLGLPVIPGPSQPNRCKQACCP